MPKELSTEPQRAQIGPYRVLRLLGRGGFGTVYLAQQSKPVEREVAVKVLNPGMDFAEIRARFEVERETLNLMKHPGISMLLDAGVTSDDEPYFAMEYVQGTPLGDYLEQNPMSMKDKLKLFRSICDAVQHAHNKGVIHRDLTANNVLVVDMDGRPMPKIIDFGIAKSIGSSLAVEMHTTEGQAMGTPAYMSPEQARGDISEIDTRTDIYTLGVQLYFILTGTLPFTMDHIRAAGVRILQMICEDEPERPSLRAMHSNSGRSLTHLLRGDLDWITNKAMAKNRQERYASVAELNEDIRRYLDNEPVLAGPPTTWYRLSKVLRRYRGLVTAAAAVLLTLIIGLIVSFNLYLQSSANAAEAEENLDRFNYLSDVLLLETLRDEVLGLGPGRPENRTQLEAWLERADGLVARLDLLRAVLAEGNALPEDADPGRAQAQNFLLRELDGLVVELDSFASDPQSPLANVRARLAWANEVHEKTIEEHAAAWAEAARGVASDARFEGVALTPQVGLVPLGADSASGLQEFVVLRSGRAPERDPATGKLLVAEDCGIVLVLLPAGTFQLGAQNKDEDAPQYDPSSDTTERWNEYDFDAEQWLRHLVPVSLGPYLISKYEVTQAQWARMTAGEHPSATAGDRYAPFGVSELCPVDNMTWERSREVLGEYGLDLPTEAQWEYACRAGTRTPWTTGRTEATLDGYANLADKSAQAKGVKWKNFAGVILDDGYVYTAPIGSYLPNAFGLHDMHGNVYERCLEPYGPYDPERLSGPNAVRVVGEDEEIVGYVVRGGAYQYRAEFARSSHRWHTAKSSPDVGLRPVRTLED